MKSILTLLFIFAGLLVSTGCSKYPGITGKVVDNVTGKPIEGALVVAQWTKKHGFGLTYHELSKITETLTDKEGVFNISGIKDPFVEPPEMIIYKEGYIPWRNDMTFPSTDIVKDHVWHSNMIYKLKIMTGQYSYEQLSSFINSAIIGSGGQNTPIYNELDHKISIKRTQEIESSKVINK